jgi:hypothetical protein
LARHRKSKQLTSKQLKLVSRGKAHIVGGRFKKISEIKAAQPKAAPTLTKAKSQGVGTKEGQALKTTKAGQTIGTTKEKEPFKPQHVGESHYEKWRQWIEDNGYDRDDVERLMQESGQPLSAGQQAVLDEFEAEGVFDIGEADYDFDLRRLTA